MAYDDDQLRDDEQNDDSSDDSNIAVGGKHKNLEIDNDDPIVAAEHDAEREQDLSEPKIDDLGYSDDQGWEGEETKRGAAKGMGDDNPTYGMHEEGGSDVVSLDALRDEEENDDDTPQEQQY